MMFRNLGILFLIYNLTAIATESLLVHSERPLQAESLPEALEPFETPISGLFIRNHHDVPVVDFDQHKIVVRGLVENPIEISVHELRKLPQKQLYAVVECSGNRRGFQNPTAGGIQWSEGAVGNVLWEGVSLAAILEKAKPKKEARFITVRGADRAALPSTPDYIRSIPLNKAMESDSLIALKMNREDLPLLHGGPARLVLPKWYGQNWIKWVTEISLTAEEDPGFYMQKAYRMPKKPLKVGAPWNPEDGEPITELLVQSLLVRPFPHELVPSGKVTLKGKAFSGAGEITQVEVSADKGKTWRVAQLFPSHPMGGWQEFQFETQPLKPGRYEFVSRARDTKGNMQPLVHPWNPAGYLRNAVSGINFWVLDSQEYSGYEVYKNQCLICHSEGIISSQKFDKKGWLKLISKMKKFGADIAPDEEEGLTRFLMGLRKRKPIEAKKSSYSVQRDKFELVKTGAAVSPEPQQLYESTCAQCHGNDGEGKIGPRLKGRLVPKADFVAAVTRGKNRMPAFGDSLTQTQVLGLWQHLQKTQ